jgi:hypothetical protein
MDEPQNVRYHEYIRALTARGTHRTAHTEWLESKGLKALGDWPNISQVDCLFGAIKRACADGSSTHILLLPTLSLQATCHGNGVDNTHGDESVVAMRKAFVCAVKEILGHGDDDTLKTSAKACLVHIRSCVKPDDPGSVADADAMAYWEQRMTDGAHVAAMRRHAGTQF